MSCRFQCKFIYLISFIWQIIIIETDMKHTNIETKEYFGRQLEWKLFSDEVTIFLRVQQGQEDFYGLDTLCIKFLTSEILLKLLDIACPHSNSGLASFTQQNSLLKAFQLSTRGKCSLLFLSVLDSKIKRKAWNIDLASSVINLIQRATGRK